MFQSLPIRRPIAQLHSARRMSACDSEATSGGPLWSLRRPTHTPQVSMDAFWDAFLHKYPGKIHQILPSNPYAAEKSKLEPKGQVSGHPARESYDEAKADCVAAVEKIVKECHRCNLRYRDPHFDIEWDLKTRDIADCLVGLHPTSQADSRTTDHPRGVKRVHQIFEQPEFYIDGATPLDIRQGIAGDCWFLAALGAIGNKPGLIERVCVARDVKVGVYGFVFYRDGEWIHTVIDDKLYLKHADWDESVAERPEWSRVSNRIEIDEEYRRAYQVGSRALYFAQCKTENETWLPLLEKAFAKAHGDYASIDGGFTGEAIEDLTGGVTTELFTSDILDVDKFWKEELSQVNEEFLFGCATGRFDNWQGGGKQTDRKGIQPRHAYSIMEAREEKEGEEKVIRLLKIRNPWGEREWTGPWGDGTIEWTPEWLELLNHKFADDGIFWISYEDWLKKFHFLDRTRLFNTKWKITQQWTSLQVPWSADYHRTKFTFELTEASRIVVVLSQLDDRYWNDFKGQYTFSLHFRINKSGEDEYIVRSHGNYCMRRSVSTELELEPGEYDVRMKVTAKRNRKRDTVDEVVKANVQRRQEKLLQVALSYDLAHAKGIITDTEEKKQRVANQNARDVARAKEDAKEHAREMKEKHWILCKKAVERKRRRNARLKAHHDKKAKKSESVQASTNEEQAHAHPANYEGSSTSVPQLSQTHEHYHIHHFHVPPPNSPHQELRISDYQAKAEQQIPGLNINFLRAPPSPDTIYSFNSSVDSDLDQDWFPHKPSAHAEDNFYLPEALDTNQDSDLESFASDPWNAVVIVGLRVFTEIGQATVKVVRPEDIIPQEQRVDPERMTHGGDPAPLDIDDQAKGVTDEIFTSAAMSSGDGHSGGDGARFGGGNRQGNSRQFTYRPVRNRGWRSGETERERERDRDRTRGGDRLSGRGVSKSWRK